MNNPAISTLFLFLGIFIVYLAIKGRIRPIIDALTSGQAQK